MHAWSNVFINGKWSASDLTWGEIFGDKDDYTLDTRFEYDELDY